MRTRFTTSLLAAALCHLVSTQHAGHEQIDQTVSTKKTGYVLWQYFLDKTLADLGMDPTAAASYDSAKHVCYFQWHIIQPFAHAGDDRYAAVVTQNCPETVIECINFTVTYPVQSGTILVDEYSATPGATSLTERCLKNVDADSNRVIGIVLYNPYADKDTFFASISYSYTFTMPSEEEDNSITEGFTRRLLDENWDEHSQYFDLLDSLPSHTRKDVFFSSKWISNCTHKPDPVEFRTKGSVFSLTSFEFEISCPENSENAIISAGKQEALDYLYAHHTHHTFDPINDLGNVTFNYADAGWVAGQRNEDYVHSSVVSMLMKLKDPADDFQIKVYLQTVQDLGMGAAMFSLGNDHDLFQKNEGLGFYYDYYTEFICGFRVWLFDTYSPENAALYQPLTEGMVTIWKPYACKMDADAVAS